MDDARVPNSVAHNPVPDRVCGGEPCTCLDIRRKLGGPSFPRRTSYPPLGDVLCLLMGCFWKCITQMHVAATSKYFTQEVVSTIPDLAELVIAPWHHLLYTGINPTPRK